MHISIDPVHAFVVWKKYLRLISFVLCRPEDLRIPFERFGQVKDVYLPKNYYTGYAVLLLFAL